MIIWQKVIKSDQLMKLSSLSQRQAANIRFEPPYMSSRSSHIHIMKIDEGKNQKERFSG